MIFRRRTSWIVSAVTITLLAPYQASVAEEETTEAKYEFQSYAGYYFPHTSEVDDDLIWGTRVGRGFQDWRWNVLAGVEYFKPSGQFSKIFFFDVSGVLHFRPDKPAIPTVFAGLGWALVDEDGVGDDDEPDISETLTGDSLFATFGIGFKVFLNRNKTWNLNMRSLARWYEDRDDGDLDREFTAGLGWVMGR